MGLALAQIAAGLPMAVSFAFAGGISVLREGRKRAALNEAVHELRRPLQALALAAPESRAEAIESSLRMAAAALVRLDGEINGEQPGEDLEAVSVRPLVEVAVRRWQPRAACAGGSLRLRWRGTSPTLPGGAFELAQALDNLIINAIEHGGGEVLIEGGVADGTLRLAVRDRGTGLPPRRGLLRRDLPAWFGGRSRHGHGLRVARRVVAKRGGSFRLRGVEGGTEAALELPIATEAAG